MKTSENKGMIVITATIEASGLASVDISMNVVATAPEVGHAMGTMFSCINQTAKEQAGRYHSDSARDAAAFVAAFSDAALAEPGESEQTVTMERVQ